MVIKFQVKDNKVVMLKHLLFMYKVQKKADFYSDE
jgi:hypothetical protein